MIGFLTEFIATTIFVTVVLVTGNALPIAITFAGSMYFSSTFGGGYLNALPLLAHFIDGKMTTEKFIAFLIAEILGTLVALWLYKNIPKKHH